ncbi:MAG: acyltransferase [Kiritimatiellae bacterium]|nr:acyltransferase [Kiritimatiellia bacterium]
MNENKRIAFLDYLRVVACFMVMAIHASEPYYLGGEAPNVTRISSKTDMLCITIVECIARVAVPLFVIASSYLLFPLKTGTGAFFKRRLTRVAVPFFIWSAAYVAAAKGDFSTMLFNFPDQAGHLWFVPMLIGLYILMPLLSPWAEKVSKRELGGWLLLWLFTTLFPFMRIAWRHLYGEPPFGAVPYLWGEAPWNAFGAFHYVSGFAGFMLLGLWFRKFSPETGWKTTLAKAVPLAVAGMCIIGIPFFLYADSFPFTGPYSEAVEMERSIEYDSIGVALATAAAFLVIRKCGRGGAFHRFAIAPLSKASYGAYLVHMFFLTPFFAAFAPRFSTPATIILTTAASFAASSATAMAIGRIPVVGKILFG